MGAYVTDETSICWSAFHLFSVKEVEYFKLDYLLVGFSVFFNFVLVTVY